MEVSNEVSLVQWLKQCCICLVHMRTELKSCTEFVLYEYVCQCYTPIFYLYIYIYIYTVLSVNEYTPFEK